MAESKGKEARKANFLKKILNGDQSTKTSSFLKRKPTLMKKAKELETFCGIEVCIVCFDQNGTVDFWPPNECEVKKRCSSYSGLNSQDKKECDHFQLLQSKKKKLIKKKGNNIDSVILNLGNWVDGLSGDSLRGSVNGLEIKIKSLKERIEFLNTRTTTATTTDDEAKCSNGNSKDWFSPDDIGTTSIDQNQINCCYYPPMEYENMVNNNHYCLEDNYNYNQNNGNDMVYGFYENPVQNNYMKQAQQIHNMGGETWDYTNCLISTDNQRSTLYEVLPISQLPFHFQ